MAEFPKLKTGAVAQYPLTREIRLSTRVLPFLDGSMQRYAMRGPRRQWRIRLAQLDEGEAARVDEFARRYLRTLEPFSFEDPLDGVVHANCVLEADTVEWRAESDWACGMELIVTAEEVE